MIINFNITGKETTSELIDIAREMADQFQEDALQSPSGAILKNTWIVYAALAQILMGSFAVNTVANELGVDENLFLSNVDKEMDKINDKNKALARILADQILSGKATMEKR